MLDEAGIEKCGLYSVILLIVKYFFSYYAGFVTVRNKNVYFYLYGSCVNKLLIAPVYLHIWANRICNANISTRALNLQIRIPRRVQANKYK